MAGSADGSAAEGRSAPITAAMLTGVVREMRGDPGRDFKTSLVAARLRTSPEAFIRAFKQMTGLSPQRFRAALRMEQAKRLLVETDRPVTEISLDVGYSSLGTFVRTFTALVGVPPGQLRRLARADGQAGIFAAAAGPRGEDRPRPAAATLAVQVEPVPAGRLVAVGLFPQNIPAGLPFDGRFVDPASPLVRLAWPAGRRRASLLAAAIAPFALEEAWAGRLAALHVCSLTASAPETEGGEEPLKMHLRRAVDTDPPFLTPVPLLLMQSGRS
jgi:AraC-like DNA-binding protein